MISEHLKPATVTGTIKYLLSDKIKDLKELGSLSNIGTIEVTTLPLDAIGSTESDIIEAGLNLFLYQVILNEGYRNFDLPTRDYSGVLSKRPLLPLNLNYIVTAYTKEKKDDFKAQPILAAAMQILHENPVLGREQIRSAEDRLRVDLGFDMEKKWNSNLADQLELVKITYLPLSLEDLTKLWASFFQTHYRLSAAYQATVVLMKSRMEPKAALPVGERAIYVLPFRQPIVDKVEPQILQVNSDRKLSIFGRNLRAAADDDNNNVIVKFGEHSEKPDSVNITDNKISITVPSLVGAGIRPIKVVHIRKLGLVSGEAREHKVLESNVIPFVVAPKITKIAGVEMNNIITATTPPVSVTQNTAFVIEFKPLVTSRQEVSLLIGDHVISIPWKAMEGRIFSWNSVVEIDEAETNNLKDFLRVNFDLEWIHEATLTVVDKRTLALSNAENIVRIRLDREPPDAKNAILSIKTLASKNDYVYEFVVRNEESILNVYAGIKLVIGIPIEGGLPEQGFAEWEDFTPGVYFLRMRIDGAESLIVDTDPESPTFRQLIGPRIEVVESGA